MTPDDALKFIKLHNIHDALLKEFVLKGLWSAAVQSLDMTVEKRKNELLALAELKMLMQKEI